MASTKEILQMDLYALLGVEGTATEKEVKKAYRQKALTCHPDKNPDNPKAAELFHQLSQALEVLTDAAARAAYDKVRAAKKQAEERNRRLDDRRKKIKLDLEARERQAEAEAQKREEFKITRTLEEEITRLREEGSRQLQEEQRLIQEQIQKEREWRLNAQSTHADFSSAPQDNRKVTPKLKLKWKCKKDDDTNGGYSQEVLQGLLQKYGDILNIIVSSKKKGSAVVEFATVRAAELACKNESGLTGTPLKITWLEGQPANADPTAPNNSSQNSLSTERDYESLVLMRMRQAAERQKLIEQMQQEDEEEETVKT
ncbi:dnaJ homolog subfamily C member 17 isoform X2 [Ictalurus furcatus]|uniref:dnaJ homolog subfamily C member 17 isoform X2 n=1 Tax=Ictalurus furcatus TaxID=66913 RepID=UPI0023504063|nr:dnaJ homolog subfamily C member 17 isoform X2 [Ictalurus furcatus]